MIVAYNALSLRPGVFDGAATYTLNLLRHLPHELRDAELVVFVRRGETRIEPSEGLSVRPFPVRGPLSRIVFESLLGGRELRRARADVLLSPNESVPLRPGVPVIVVAQNLVYHRDGPADYLGGGIYDRLVSRAQAFYYRRRMRRAYRRATAVVAVSEETARVLSRRAGLEPEKTTVVLEGADSFLLPEPGDAVERNERMLVVSTISPYKNLQQTLELYAALRSQRPALELVVAGSDWRGYRTVLERAAVALGLGKLRIEDRVGGVALANLYETSRILVHLSSCESFGLPVVEAMRYGLPVVAANRSSLPEVAGGAALLVDPDDIEAATASVAALLESDDALAAAAAAGRRRVEGLRWSESAAAIATLLRRVAPG